MGCADPRWQGVARRYVDGRLSENERSAFEDHYFACDACFEEVERLQQSRPARVGDRGVETKPPAVPSRMRGWWPVALAAALALALGLGVWLLSRTRNAPSSEAGGVPVASGVEQPGEDTRPTAVPNAAADTLVADGTAPERLESGFTYSIAEIEPPRYEPVVLRGTESDAEARFAAGMEWYQRGEYAGAVPLLSSAAQIDPEAARIQFFLGASQLLNGETAAALESLGRVVTLGTTPYLEEATLLRAKARLIEGDASSAMEELERVIAMEGDHYLEARALMARLRPSGVAR
jgi:tetratricopeptide (TPR) repeat protein